MSGIFGQLAPASSVWTDLYTCPAGTVSVLRVIVSNRGAAATSFRVAVSENGDAIANLHHIASDKAIAGNDTGSTVSFVVSATDIVRVWAGNTSLSFTATGESRAA